MPISNAIATAIIWFSMILRICMFARAMMSWFPGTRDGMLFNFLSAITEPFISPIRRLFAKSPLGGGMIDLSFIVALLLLTFLTPPLANWVRSLPF
ncbi:MAG: YggT family protein [Defluviitaleaceae bacterium]|nr:YggT family protein [Defluviitaleaceae bacterium]